MRDKIANQLIHDLLNSVQFGTHSFLVWLRAARCHMGSFPNKVSPRPVLRVDVSRWDQTAADLRGLALHADHPRSRERFLALHEIVQGGCTTAIATRSGRHPQTVMGWVHAYNKHGPAALLYRRSGGRPPFARGSRRRSAKQSAPPSSLRLSRP